jgi:hypothetical protein
MLSPFSRAMPWQNESVRNWRRLNNDPSLARAEWRKYKKLTKELLYLGRPTLEGLVEPQELIKMMKVMLEGIDRVSAAAR